MDPLISIIVPVYNVEPYIRQCLKSICQQTFKELEIIVIDDGSDDKSGNICDEYARKDNRIQVIHKKNEGLVKARKEGLALARGEYVTYVDGDDWIEPNMVKRLVEILEKEKVDVIIHGRYYDIGETSTKCFHGFEAGRYDRKRLEKDIFPGMIVNHGLMKWGIYPNVWDKLYRKSLLWEYQMQVEDTLTMGEDAACVYPCLLEANSIYILNECFYHYRPRSISMVRSGRTTFNEKDMYRCLYDSVSERLKKFDLPDNLQEQWKDYLLFLMIPRSDILYNNYEKLDYLFPYPNVKRGDSVVIYGAGVYGMKLYEYLKESGFCEVKGIADRDYKNLNTDTISVMAPEKVAEIEADHILIAIIFENTRNAVINRLKTIVKAQKIETIDVELARSSVSWEAYGMK